MKNPGLPTTFIEGRLTADPELRVTNSGKQVVSFTIAAGERRLSKQTNEWEDGERMFLRCTAWEELAGNIAASLHRGDPVIARVRVYQSEYTTREGEKRTSVEGRVESIGATLDRHTVSVTKAGQDGGPAGGGWAAPSHGSAPQYGSTEGGGYGADGQQSFGSFDDEQPF